MIISMSFYSKDDVLAYYEQCQRDESKAVAVTAIETLIHFMENSKAETLQGLIAEMNQVINILKHTEGNVTSIASGCELFIRFITLESVVLESSPFNKVISILVEEGSKFIKKISKARAKIAQLAQQFIENGAVILTHSISKCVMDVLVEAKRMGKRFLVYVTQSGPDNSGKGMYDKLIESGISATLILDSATGYIMESVDMVIVGAEGVVENGGILNKIGTYGIAICAQYSNKPVYVAAESFKFVRLYPLNQRDIPNSLKYNSSVLEATRGDTRYQHPKIDYTPPNLITLLFTNLGVLTPSAVSDELIKQYL